MISTSQTFLEDRWYARDSEWPGLYGTGDTQDEALRDLERKKTARRVAERAS